MTLLSGVFLVFGVLFGGFVAITWGGWKDGGLASWLWSCVQGAFFLGVLVLILNMCGAMDSPDGYRGG